MKTGKHELEAITIRRAKIADADKVRYRVYTTPNEFIAVIAESALMAVKVSGVKAPHKIMRDLPTEGVAIEARKMAEMDELAERVALRLQVEDKPEQRMAELMAPEDMPVKPFVPVGIADLRAKGGARARILPPDLLNEIIEEHNKNMAKPIEEAPPPSPVPPEPVVPPEPEMTTKEKIVQLADEVFPPPAPEVEEIEIQPQEPGLTPEEVGKLLNG